MSDAATLSTSLRLLAGIRPDLVISSAFPSPTAIHVPGNQWAGHVTRASHQLAAVACA